MKSSKGISKPHAPALVRFWAKVDKSGECWLWTARKDKRGYGYFRVGKQMRRAHRFIFEETHGQTEQFVCHRCDNPSCVRVDHMFVGTHEDNMADMKAKGRRLGKCTGDNNGQSASRRAA